MVLLNGTWWRNYDFNPVFYYLLKSFSTFLNIRKITIVTVTRSNNNLRTYGSKAIWSLPDIQLRYWSAMSRVISSLNGVMKGYGNPYAFGGSTEMPIRFKRESISDEIFAVPLSSSDSSRLVHK